jgi:hypothetical protein
MIKKLFLEVVLICGALTAPLLSQQEEKPPECPLHAQHTQQPAGHEGHGDAAALDARGDQVMGFGHTQTQHRFSLREDGGTIQVEAKDPADTASLSQIRAHLAQVAKAFSGGDFTMPAAIHDRVLPGVSEMTRLRDAIQYRYEDTERGGRVRITTVDRQALLAVHAFLRAQIVDHRTGDPLHLSGHAH